MLMRWRGNCLINLKLIGFQKLNLRGFQNLGGGLTALKLQLGNNKRTKRSPKLFFSFPSLLVPKLLLGNAFRDASRDAERRQMRSQAGAQSLIHKLNLSFRREEKSLI